MPFLLVSAQPSPALARLRQLQKLNHRSWLQVYDRSNSSTAKLCKSNPRPIPLGFRRDPYLNRHSALSARSLSSSAQGCLHAKPQNSSGYTCGPSHNQYLSLLKACHCRHSSHQARQVYAFLVESGAEFTGLLGDYLVITLAKCHALNDALAVLRSLPTGTVYPWTALILSSVDCGQFQEALEMYAHMLEANVQPNEFTFVSLFKACGAILDLEQGKQLHNDAQTKGFATDVFVGSALLSMYGKCGSMAEAENTFIALIHRNMVTWNAMLSMYVEQAQGHKALQLYRQMEEEEISRDEQTYTIALQACGTIEDKGPATLAMSKEIGQALQVDAWSKGFTSDAFLGDTLLNVYSNCGAIAEAECVFVSLTSHNVVSWTTLLSAYVKQGQIEKALLLYRQMQEFGVNSDKQALTVAIQACCDLAESVTFKDSLLLERSLQISGALHADAWRKQFLSDVFVGSSLVTLYSKHGCLLEAENIFSKIPKSDNLLWTVMLSAYAEEGLGERALQLYSQMQVEGFAADQHSLSMAIQACGALTDAEAIVWEEQLPLLGFLEIGQTLHHDACMRGYTSDVFVGSGLVSMYGAHGTIQEAESMFIGLPFRNVVSWSAMLSSFVERGQGEKALNLYWQMLEEGVDPDRQAFVIALQACIVVTEKMTSLEIGQALHSEAQREGLMSYVFVRRTLVSLYGRHGTVSEMENLFDGGYDIKSWNAMLSAYVEQGHAEKALVLYTQMHAESVAANQRSFAIALQACCALAEEGEGVSTESQSSKIVSFNIGQALHADARNKGFDFEILVGNALINMYGKCRKISEAENVFHKLTELDVMSWNALLQSYAEQGFSDKTLHLYSCMCNESVPLNHTTLACVLQVGCETGGLEVCRQLDFDRVASGYDWSLLLANTLIHAYGNCASMVDAQAVFNKLAQPDLVSWSSCIAGYAQGGDYRSCMELFEEMQMAGLEPDGVTYVSILSACNHTGLVTEGFSYFREIRGAYGQTIGSKHFSIMIDLLGRAGDLKSIGTMLQAMPMEADLPTWLCLLGACCTHGNSVLGRFAFNCAVDLEPREGAAYVMMSNICAANGPLEISKMQ